MYSMRCDLVTKMAKSNPSSPEQPRWNKQTDRELPRVPARHQRHRTGQAPAKRPDVSVRKSGQFTDVRAEIVASGAWTIASVRRYLADGLIGDPAPSQEVPSPPAPASGEREKPTKREGRGGRRRSAISWEIKDPEMAERESAIGDIIQYKSQ